MLRCRLTFIRPNINLKLQYTTPHNQYKLAHFRISCIYAQTNKCHGKGSTFLLLQWCLSYVVICNYILFLPLNCQCGHSVLLSKLQVSNNTSDTQTRRNLLWILSRSRLLQNLRYLIYSSSWQFNHNLKYFETNIRFFSECTELCFKEAPSK